MKTIRLTAAQALVRYLEAQKIFLNASDKKPVRLFAGGFGIFGHGNVPALGEALFDVRKKMPLYRGHNEQSMAHAAIAYAKASRCRQMMFCTSSIGPGATNMVTAAALAYVNRLPALFLPGDIFATRHPDPVLQQSENGADPTASVNDCFKPVSRFWDRIMRPEQLLQSLPAAIAMLLDPQNRGPATICLPQDAQGFAYDYPVAFFQTNLRSIRRPQPDAEELRTASQAIKNAKTPLIIAGGGTLYAGAEEVLANFAGKHRIAVGQTQAGKGSMLDAHPADLGAIGVTGTSAANALAEKADLVLAVGTRLQDFTTASRSLFKNPKMRLIQLNTCAFDTVKHGALPLLADAKVGLEQLDKALGSWRSGAAYAQRVESLRAQWRKVSDRICGYNGKDLPSDAQVARVVNEFADERSTVVCAAGSLPAELHKHWRNKSHDDYHLEYGYSCMGYEIAAGLGIKMARPEREIFVVIGDGSYLMLNSEIATAVAMGAKINLVVLDNGGFGCINRLQQACGAERFNNLLHHPNTAPKTKQAIDFVKHAESLGATAEKLDHLNELPAALARAVKSPNVYVLVLDTSPEITTQEGGRWWEVGMPEVSSKPKVIAARQQNQAGKSKQKLV